MNVQEALLKRVLSADGWWAGAALLGFFASAAICGALMRLDQWLWAVRLYKTRVLAAAAIKGGLVKIDGAVLKPAHSVRSGEIVVARTAEILRTVRVIDSPRSRVGAKLVPLYAEDLTPPEEYARRAEAASLAVGARERGAGRPTKRDRRELDEVTDELPSTDIVTEWLGEE